MPATNDLNYSNEELLLAQIGKAISHPARARMLINLMNKGTFRNIDFSKNCGLSIATTHHHIYKLKDADLINLEYINHQYFVTFKPDNIDILRQLLVIEKQKESENYFNPKCFSASSTI